MSREFQHVEAIGETESDQAADTWSAPLGRPQSGRASLQLGRQFEMKVEVHINPLGLLAISGLVSAILLSVPPIITAARR